MEVQKIETSNLDHLGLVAALIKKLNLIDIVDSVLPKISNNAGISHGKIVAALIINGLGFTERRLYMVSHFFKNKPIDKLIDPAVTADDLNDDQIGRTLDAINEFGTTELFFYLWMEISREFKFFNPFAHLDSTTFSLTGAYDTNENEVLITYGHSKDHRPDLKQVTLNMAVTDKGIPFWMETLPGNSSDVVSFHKTIEIFTKFKNELNSTQWPIWVADCALFTTKRLLRPDLNFLWITRAPERIKQVREYLEENDAKIDWKELDNGNKFCSYDVDYYSGPQKLDH